MFPVPGKEGTPEMKSRFFIAFCALTLASALVCGAAEVSPEEAARAAEA